MRGSLQQQTIALENGETTSINHFYVTSLEVLSPLQTHKYDGLRKRKDTVKQCPIEMSSESDIFRSLTVVKMCYRIEVMGYGVSWLRAAS